MIKKVSSDSFNNWLASPLGRHVLALQNYWLSRWLKNSIFAHKVVIFGSYLQGLKIDEKTHLIAIQSELKTMNFSGSLIADYAAVPVKDESVDIVILPHTLDFHSMPQEVLREAYRILRPEGRLYLTSFNVLSLWGIYKVFASLLSQMPWRLRFSNFLQIEDWLGEVGFDIISSRSVGYCLPFNIEKLIALQAIIDKLALKLKLPFGAVNLFEVHKRVSSLTLQPPLIPLLVTNFGIESADANI
jgi:SAM-dependent methyltransferase